ncbi:MAG: hypothetical protein ACJ71G_17925 [Nitrososphaeraceae archaeon]
MKTTIANQTRNSDYSEWFLGHKKSSYYTNKLDELKRIYKEDCMKYLTFLDFPTVEATGRTFEAQLKQKDKEIEELKAQMRHETVTKDDAIGTLSDQLLKLKERLDKMEEMR